MIRLALSTAIALVVGLYLGHRLAGGAGEPQSIAAMPSVLAQAEGPARGPTLTPEDIELLKRELAAIIPAPAVTARSRNDDPVVMPRPVSMESMAADEIVRDMTYGAVAAGRWTAQDAEAMHGLMGQASAGAVHEAMTALVAAANEQRLEIETKGPPF